VEPSGPCSCIYKGRSKHCSTFRYSNPHVPDYSVHDISRIGNSPKKLKEIIDGGVFTLENIPTHIKLSDIQQAQISRIQLGRNSDQERGYNRRAEETQVSTLFYRLRNLSFGDASL